MINEYRPEMISGMKELAKHGYKCFATPSNDNFVYGYMITPSKNILYVQRDSYHWRGWTFSLSYVPSRKNGSGCGCLEDPAQNFDLATVQQAEKEGLAFARRLGATLYNSPEDWEKSYYRSGEMEEVN